MRGALPSLISLAVLLAACAQAAQPPTTPTPFEAEGAPPPSPTVALAATPEPVATTPVPQPPEPLAVDVPGAQGLTLRGTYYPVAEAPGPGVLLLHMYARNRGDWDEFARRLQSAGVASLAIDLRGHGETGEDEDWELAQQDVLSALTWLASQADVDGERTGVVGASIGANLALWLGAEEPALDAIALLSPGFEYFRVQIEGLIERYGDRPVFLAASEDDRYSADTVQALATAASGPAELVVYEAAGHGTDMFAAEPDLAAQLLAFLLNHLKP